MNKLNIGQVVKNDKKAAVASDGAARESGDITFL